MKPNNLLFKTALACVMAIVLFACNQSAEKSAATEEEFTCDCKIGEPEKVPGKDWVGVGVTLPKRQPKEELIRIAKHVKERERQKGNKKVSVHFTVEIYPKLTAAYAFANADSAFYIKDVRTSYEDYEAFANGLKDDKRDVQAAWIYHQIIDSYSFFWVLYKEDSKLFLSSTEIHPYRNREDIIPVKMEELPNSEKKITGKLPDGRTHIIIDAKGNAQAAMTLTPDLLEGVKDPDVSEPFSASYITGRVWYTPLEKVK